MTPTDVTSALATEHIRDLRVAAQATRLAALARRCRPTAWRPASAHALGRRFRSWVRRAQLGPTNNYCACA